MGPAAPVLVAHDVSTEVVGVARALHAAGRPAEALAHLLVRLERHPDCAVTWLWAGRIANALGEPSSAVDALRRATEYAPDDAEAWLELGSVLLQLGWRTEPLACFERAATVAPERAEVHTRLGVTRLALGLADAARDALERARALEPEQPETLAGVARLWVRDGRAADAMALLEPVARAERPHREVALAYSEACLAEGRPLDGVSALRRVLVAERPPLNRALVLHALGRSFEAAGDADAAFTAFRNANRARGLSVDPEAVTAAIERIATGYSAERMATAPRASVRSRRPILLVGLPRTGTSLLERILASHPAIAAGGELDALPDLTAALPALHRVHGDDVDALDRLEPAFLDGLAGRYLSVLESIDPYASHVVDKLPDNWRRIGLASLVLPETTIVHCTRDAMDTLWSCFRQPFGTGLAWTTSFEGLAATWRAHDRLMAHWKATVPGIVEVRYEELVARPEAALAPVLDALGLAWDPAMLQFHTSQAPTATASAAQVRRPLYVDAVGRSAPYARHLEPLRRMLT